IAFAQIEIFQVLFDMKAVKQFQAEVLEVIGSVATEARDEIIRRLTERNALRSTLHFSRYFDICYVLEILMICHLKTANPEQYPPLQSHQLVSMANPKCTISPLIVFYSPIGFAIVIWASIVNGTSMGIGSP